MQKAEIRTPARLRAGDFSVSTGQMRATKLRQIIAAVARAGFDGLVLGMDVYTRAREDGLSAADISNCIADHGLKIEYLDGLIGWVEGAPAPKQVPGAVRLITDPEQFFEAASAISAPMINAVEVFGFNPGFERLVESFDRLTGRAAGYGLDICLEFTPLGAVPGLAQASAIVQAVARPNGGILLDSWHFKRSDSSLADVRAAAPERIFAVQLSDTGPTPFANAFEEAMHYRMLPGEGSAAIPQLLDCLAECGVRRPFSAEVYSDPLLALPINEMLALTLAALRRVAPREAI